MPKVQKSIRSSSNSVLPGTILKGPGLLLAAALLADPSATKLECTRNPPGGDLLPAGIRYRDGNFGDPALGAQGNPATASLGIRNALSAAGQRGYNAAVTFHLGPAAYDFVGRRAINISLLGTLVCASSQHERISIRSLTSAVLLNPSYFGSVDT